MLIHIMNDFTKGSNIMVFPMTRLLWYPMVKKKQQGDCFSVQRVKIKIVEQDPKQNLQNGLLCLCRKTSLLRGWQCHQPVKELQSVDHLVLHPLCGRMNFQTASNFHKICKTLLNVHLKLIYLTSFEFNTLSNSNFSVE